MVPRRSAFTLIELLVTVAIIGLLISIGVPTFSQVRLMGKRTVCMANLHSIGQALEAYLSVNNDYWPHASFMISQDANLPAISEVLRREIGGARTVFRCPADRGMDPNDPIRFGKPYYDTEKTSYEWDVLGVFNGVKRGHDLATSAAGLGWGSADVPLMQDWECFHGGASRPHSCVVMYADFTIRTSADRIRKDHWGSQ